MKLPKNTTLYLTMLITSILLLLVEYKTKMEFFFHLAAIPLEVLVGTFIIHKILNMHEAKEKRRQLMFVKSYLFRAEMRRLFITNFDALKYPSVTMSIIKNATLKELQQKRKEAENAEYISLEAMEPVIMEYVKTKQTWIRFLERAISYDFPDIFNDMIYILHFVNDVSFYKNNYPKMLFMYHAEREPYLMEKTKKVLGDGIRKFLDYMVELKMKQPILFREIISDYELVAKIEKFRKKEKIYTLSLPSSSSSTEENNKSTPIKNKGRKEMLMQHTQRKGISGSRDVYEDVYNRRGFFVLAEQLMNECKKNNNVMLLFLLRIDQYKYAYGSQYKLDERLVVKEFIQICKKSFLDADIIARIARSDLAVIAMENNNYELAVINTRLRENIEIAKLQGRLPPNVAIMISSAYYDPRSNDKIDTLLSHAYQSMYK